MQDIFLYVSQCITNSFNVHVYHARISLTYAYKHHLVSSVSRAFVCESSDQGSNPGRFRSILLLFIMKKSFYDHSRYIPQPLQVDIYRSNYQTLAKVKASGTGKLFDSLPRECAVTELCSRW